MGNSARLEWLEEADCGNPSPMKTDREDSWFPGASIALAALLLLLAPGCAHSPPGAQKPFNGSSLAGWRGPHGAWRTSGGVKLDPIDAKLFAIRPGEGLLVNGDRGRTVNLVSDLEHGDVEAHIEFCVPKQSNSGVYFQGCYEIQVLDSWGVKAAKSSDCGGIYERWANGKGYEGHAPRVNASRAPGAWQSFDVVFRAPRFDAQGRKIENARFVQVLHNGILVHRNVELSGPTRSATFEHDEKPRGPLMLQGDHGPVAYRNLWLRPVRLP